MALLFACATKADPAEDAGPVNQICVSNDQCNDRLICTDDACVDGVCVHNLNDAACPDGKSCFRDRGCAAPAASCSEDRDCADGIGCTRDRCVEGACQNMPDESECRVGEVCVAGVGCIQEPPVGCDADVDCASHDCAGDWRCVGDDEEFKGCQLLGAPDCNDNDSCTSDRCVPALGGCVNDLRDVDKDGSGDAACGGGDCDDEDPNVLPGAEEVCDGVDQNCVGGADEGLGGGACTTSCGSTGAEVCNGAAGTSCDPPSEVCNGVDDDCVGGADNGFACVQGENVTCASIGAGNGTATCKDDCSGYDTSGCVVCVPEVCNGADDDCDGPADEDFTCVQGSTTTCASLGEGSGTATCKNDCSGYDISGCSPVCNPEVCNGADDDCDASPDEDFACVQDEVVTCASIGAGNTGNATCANDCSGYDTSGCQNCVAEICNGSDDDCDGPADEDFTCVQGSTTSCSSLGEGTGTATCKNDCSGYDTSSCVPDACVPNQSYAISQIDYQCANVFILGPLVNLDFSEVTFNDSGSSLEVDLGANGEKVPGGGCEILTGDSLADGSFSVTCTYAGTCDEIYTLTGTYDHDSCSWTGTFTAEFVGSCRDCTTQQWNVGSP